MKFCVIILLILNAYLQNIFVSISVCYNNYLYYTNIIHFQLAYPVIILLHCHLAKKTNIGKLYNMIKSMDGCI